jgi:glucose-1-phosphate cytidylyltransferase
MKVVLFCGGFGLRIREYSEEIPKPMVPIGHRPILWHVMKYYAHFGHTDFILCLGHQAQIVKRYFLDYDECLSNDFTLADGGRTRKPVRRDIANWNITFVDTGISANIGQRLLAVREYLRNEELFLANYSDGLTDFPLPQLIDGLRASGRVAAFLCVRPAFSVHFVEATAAGDVLGLQPADQADLWINGGYFVFRQEIFEYLLDGEELVVEPLQRLMRERKLLARKYDGFFQAMDTFKERQSLEQRYLNSNGHAAWMVWAPSPSGNGQPARGGQ